MLFIVRACIHTSWCVHFVAFNWLIYIFSKDYICLRFNTHYHELSLSKVSSVIDTKQSYETQMHSLAPEKLLVIPFKFLYFCEFHTWNNVFLCNWIESQHHNSTNWNLIENVSVKADWVNTKHESSLCILDAEHWAMWTLNSVHCVYEFRTSHPVQIWLEHKIISISCVFTFSLGFVCEVNDSHVNLIRNRLFYAIRFSKWIYDLIWTYQHVKMAAQKRYCWSCQPFK